MALDDLTAQAQLTPEARRAHLRAFADRMLLKITAMDDPEDMPGVERAVRVAAVIERVYSRCDRAERQIRVEAPDLFKAEAECATHQVAAIEARVSLANTLKWEEERRLALGAWYDAAQSVPQTSISAAQTPAAVAHVSDTPDEQPAEPSQTPVSHALKSYTSGDATPGPNSATTDLVNERSGKSLRSSASEWPP